VLDPFDERGQMDAALEVAARMARAYLKGIADERVLSPDVEVALGRWSDPMPEQPSQPQDRSVRPPPPWQLDYPPDPARTGPAGSPTPTEWTH
jgi:hypothetical protein